MKKILAFLLVAVMALSSVSTSFADPIVTEPLTLKVMIAIRDIDTLTEPNDMPAVQALEARTGIHIDWEVIKASDFDTKVNLMFATDEYPDIILTVQNTFDYEEYGATQGLVIPLNAELTSKYMPNYTERLAGETNDPLAALVASDGNIYAIGTQVSQDYNTDQPFFINKAWMDNLGITEMPATIDELTQLLIAFRDGDANGNGDPSDEIPVQMTIKAWGGGLRFFLPLFGLPVGDKWIHITDDQQIEFIPTTGNFRTAMETFHTWYKEGLMDPAVLSQDDNTYNSKIQEGNVGFFVAWRLTKMSTDLLAENAVLYVPEYATLNRSLQLANDGAYLTVTNEHVEESLRWLDALIDKETMYSLYYGPYNEAMDANGWTYLEDGRITTFSSGDVTTKNYLDCNTLFFAPSNWVSKNVKMASQYEEKADYSHIYEDAGIVEKYSSKLLTMMGLTSEQLADIALIETDITNAVYEHVVKFMTEGVTDKNWEEFVKIFDKMKVEEKYVKVYQDATDVYFAK